MNQAVSAADANRRFSELLRAVKKGRSVVVTSHGKPVAKITPFAGNDLQRCAPRPLRQAPRRTRCKGRTLDA